MISPHVGGGFGSKGTTRPHAIIAALAARRWDSPVKVALTRSRCSRSPATGRRRSSGWAGRRRGRHADRARRTTSSSTPRRCAPSSPSRPPPAPRYMYARADVRTTHRLAALTCRPVVDARAWRDPGMYALESAIDELAIASASTRSSCGSRTTRAAEPDSGLPFSSRNLIACLREGAGVRRGGRDPTARRPPRRPLADQAPGSPRRLPGAAVAPRRRPPAPTKRVRYRADRRRRHRHWRADRAWPRSPRPC